MFFFSCWVIARQVVVFYLAAISVLHMHYMHACIYSVRLHLVSVHDTCYSGAAISRDMRLRNNAAMRAALIALFIIKCSSISDSWN